MRRGGEGFCVFFSFLLYSACLFLSDKCLLLRVLCCVFGSDTFHIYIYVCMYVCIVSYCL